MSGRLEFLADPPSASRRGEGQTQSMNCSRRLSTNLKQCCLFIIILAFSRASSVEGVAFPHLCFGSDSPIPLAEKGVLTECPHGGFPFARCSPKRLLKHC